MKLKLALLFLATFQIAHCQEQQKNLNQISKNGYTISYSNDLRLDESGKGGTEFFLTTQAKEGDNFVENLNLMIEDLQGVTIDLDGYVEVALSKINLNGKIIERKKGKNGENEFHMMIYEVTYEGIDIKFLQKVFLKNNRAYILTYTANKSDYEKYLGEMESIMNSFKI